MAACRVGRGRGYDRRSSRMSNGRGCRKRHGRCRTNIGRAEKLELTRKICSNLLEEIPAPLSALPVTTCTQSATKANQGGASTVDILGLNRLRQHQ